MSYLRRQDGIAFILEVILIGIVLAAAATVVSRTVFKSKPGNPIAKVINLVSGGGGIDPWNEPCHIKESGRRELTASPIKFEDIDIISPMGAMIGGHVTPIDHMYFYPKPTPGNRFSAAVYAAADGTITNIQHRGELTNGPADARPGSDEFRMTIEQTCNQGYYYDLITKLAPDLKAKVGTLKAYDSKPLDIQIKAGQLIGYVGNQSLDFGVYDTTVKLNFIVPEHYVGEVWKIHTAEAFKYFEAKMLAQLSSKILRTAEPRSGKIDYDKDGYLVGNWFEQGTNGYAGKDGHGGSGYWSGHLAVAYNDIDPRLVEISIGSLVGSNGQGGQYAVAGNAPDPVTINQASGLVKYQLTYWNYKMPDGSDWDRHTPQPTMKAEPGNGVVGTALLQLTGQRTLRMEVFLGKYSAQVSSFTSAAKTYER